MLAQVKTMDTDPLLLETFHAQGHRLTHQRKLVLQVLAESNEHLDAETVFLRAKALDPRVSLATVYRSLAILKQLDLVKEHTLGESHGHFETVHRAPHYHFTCGACGKVIEFDAPQILEIARRLSRDQGMYINDMHLHFSGTCAECLENELGSSAEGEEPSLQPGREW
jgi:Fe2+ or Zn2+ uptake regulation protein